MRPYPDTFLDYLPAPAMGMMAYREKLEISYQIGKAQVPPIYALLKVTDRCNSQCAYCGHAGGAVKADIPTHLMKSVLEQIAASGATSVNFSGGEPLMRDDLPELVAFSRSLGLFPVLLTNGLLLEKRRAELLESGVGMVIVSMDSIVADSFSATRGVGLAPILVGIESLLTWPENVRPVLTVTSVMTCHNISHLTQLVEYCADRGIGVQFTPYHHNGRWEDDQLSPRDQLTYHQAINGLREIKRADGGIVNSDSYLAHCFEFNSKERRVPVDYRCYCGYTTLFIDSDLNIRSCWSHGLPVAGNLQEERLEEILKDSRMRSLRKRIKELRCERCWLLCTAEISLRFQ